VHPQNSEVYFESRKWSKERREMAASTTISLIAQLEAASSFRRAEAEGLMEELLCERMDTRRSCVFCSRLTRGHSVEELAACHRHAPSCHTYFSGR